MDLKLEFNAGRNLLAVRQISTILRGALSSLLAPGSLFAVEVALTEHCTNAVKHVSRQETDGPLTVQLDLTGDEIRLKFVDRGEPFDSGDFVRPIVDADNRSCLPTNGMGLSLIHDTMDEVNFQREDDVNTVTLVKKVTLLEQEGA